MGFRGRDEGGALPQGGPAQRAGPRSEGKKTRKSRPAPNGGGGWSEVRGGDPRAKVKSGVFVKQKYHKTLYFVSTKNIIKKITSILIGRNSKK